MTPMKDRASIGSRWRRRRDKSVWLLKQSHRSDRIAELRWVEGPKDGFARRIFVSFTDLRTKFEEADT